MGGTVEELLSSVGPVLTIGGTIYGVWLVLRLIGKFQEDFSDRYREELAEVRDDLAAERTAHALTERRATAAELEVARLIRRLVEEGVDP